MQKKQQGLIRSHQKWSDCLLIWAPASFISLEKDFFAIFARTLPMFLRVFSNFTVSTEGYLGPLPHKKGVLFDVS